MAEESSGLVLIHASFARISVKLLSADASDFRITCLRVGEYQSANAGLRSHGITFRQFYSKAAFVFMPMFMSVTVSMLVTVPAGA